jgi:5-formyltetrahydrofolate cyclo-ligase
MDPRPLLAALARAGRNVALPRMESRAGPARFLSWRANEILKADAFGVLAPPPDSPALKPKLILVPLLAFDRIGNRLGQGGGHYDRILKEAHHDGALAVGLAYAAQEMPLVPSEPHDELLDWVVTENEAIQCVGRKLKK